MYYICKKKTFFTRAKTPHFKSLAMKKLQTTGGQGKEEHKVGQGVPS